MKIPETIKIGGHNYTVEIKNLIEDSGSGDWGSCDTKKAKIFIDSTLIPSHQEETLFHEVIETLDYLNQWELSHSIIQSLSHNFYQVLKDNNLLK